MKYCSECLMPDTRPGIKFIDGVCIACIHYKKQKETNWDNRKKEFETLCEKYRTENRDEYDCAIAVSGGKDSHFQVYVMKEIMKITQKCSNNRKQQIPKGAGAAEGGALLFVMFVACVV